MTAEKKIIVNGEEKKPTKKIKLYEHKDQEEIDKLIRERRDIWLKEHKL